MKGLFTKLSIHDPQHNNNTAIMLKVIMLSVTFYLYLCLVLFCLMSWHNISRHLEYEKIKTKV
jgi:hypothetical protein